MLHCQYDEVFVNNLHCDVNYALNPCIAWHNKSMGIIRSTDQETFLREVYPLLFRGNFNLNYTITYNAVNDVLVYK